MPRSRYFIILAILVIAFGARCALFRSLFGNSKEDKPVEIVETLDLDPPFQPGGCRINFRYVISQGATTHVGDGILVGGALQVSGPLTDIDVKQIVHVEVTIRGVFGACPPGVAVGAKYSFDDELEKVGSGHYRARLK